MKQILFVMLIFSPLLTLSSVSSQSGKSPAIGRVSPPGVNAREPQATVGMDGSVWVTYGVDNALFLHTICEWWRDL